MKRTPHTRGSIMVVAALSVALFGVVAAAQLGVFFQETPVPELTEEELAPFTLSNTAPLSEADSDGDGLPDWKENLIGTDPHNSDSDGNGELDQAPNPSNILEDTPDSAESTEGGLALTVGQQLISKYLEAKQSGEFDLNYSDDLVRELQGELRIATPFTPFVAEQVAVDADVSPERIALYREEMQEMMRPLLSLGEAEMTTYARFIDTGEGTELESITSSSVVYAKVADALMELTIPQDAVEEHLALSNALAFYARTLNDLVLYEDKPLESLVLLRALSEAEAYVHTTFNSLFTYYSLKLRAS